MPAVEMTLGNGIGSGPTVQRSTSRTGNPVLNHNNFVVLTIIHPRWVRGGTVKVSYFRSDG